MAVPLLLALASRAAGSGGDRPPAATIAEACDLISQAIGHTRSLTLELSPPILYELGLVPAIEWLAESVQKQHGISITVHDDGQDKPVDEQVRGLLFGAIRELLVNVIKHAKAKNVMISTWRREQGIRVIVEDDGVGFANPELLSSGESGFGLFNIRERLAYLGGGLEVESEAGHGSRVILTAPQSAKASHAGRP